MQVGQCRKQEYEYTRHGTYCLTANWDVVEGKVISPTIGDTRDEIDFQQHLEQTVKSDPRSKKVVFHRGQPQHAQIGTVGLLGIGTGWNPREGTG